MYTLALTPSRLDFYNRENHLQTSGRPAPEPAGARIMFPNIGIPELIIILGIALIVFGPRKLPELGRSLGRSLGEFRKASNELKHTLEEEVRIEEQRDQRAKMQAEQSSAVAAASPAPIEPGPTGALPTEESTVSRTTAG